MTEIIINKSDLYDIAVNEFHTIHFDLRNINVEKLKQKFAISTSDTLIAVYSIDKLFSKNTISIVFTDKGFYTLIGRSRLLFSDIEFSGIVIDYNHLNNYIVSHEKNAVTLLGYKDKIIIQKKPVIIRTLDWEKGREELERFIGIIQKKVQINNYDEMKKAQQTKDLFRMEIRHALDICLPLYDESKKNVLKKESSFREEYYQILIQDFNIYEIEQELHCEEINKPTIDNCLKYVVSYYEAIKDPNLYTSEETIRRRILNLNQIDIDENKIVCDVCKKIINMRNMFLFYYDLRENPFISISEIVKRASETRFASNEIIESIRFANIYKNHLMACILSELREKQPSTIARYSGFRDGLELDCMHYAIITGNTNLVKKDITYYQNVIENPKHTNIVGYNPYDYAFVAFVVGNEELGKYLFENSGEIKKLKDAQASLKKMIAAQKNILMHKRVDRKNTSDFNASSMEYSYERIKCLTRDYEELAKEIEKKRECFYGNIYLWKANMANMPLMANLYSSYLNPEILELFLCEIDKHIHIYNKKKDIHIKIDFFDETDFDEKKVTNDDLARPYGNSWFSPNAHTDYEILKKEYYAYAKKYHPDNAPEAEQIFKEINDERLAIIHSL